MHAADVTLLREWMARDFRIRYTQTSLGALWALAQPVALTVTFVFLFQKVAKIQAPVPYASFVLPAMLIWTLFSAGVTNSANAMASSMYIAAKASYPRVVAPLSASLLALVDLAAGLLLLPVVFLVQGAPLQLNPLPCLAAALGCLLMSAGLGALMSALTIFIRDLRNLLPLGLQLALLLTPVAYPADRLPSVLRGNPLATFVNGFRSGLLDVPGPTGLEWARSLLIAFAVLLVGLWYFHRVESRFADVA